MPLPTGRSVGPGYGLPQDDASALDYFRSLMARNLQMERGGVREPIFNDPLETPMPDFGDVIGGGSTTARPLDPMARYRDPAFSDVIGGGSTTAPDATLRTIIPASSGPAPNDDGSPKLRAVRDPRTGRVTFTNQSGGDDFDYQRAVALERSDQARIPPRPTFADAGFGEGRTSFVPGSDVGRISEQGRVNALAGRTGSASRMDIAPDAAGNMTPMMEQQMFERAGRRAALGQLGAQASRDEALAADPFARERLAPEIAGKTLGAQLGAQREYEQGKRTDIRGFISDMNDRIAMRQIQRIMQDTTIAPEDKRRAILEIQQRAEQAMAGLAPNVGFLEAPRAQGLQF